MITHTESVRYTFKPEELVQFAKAQAQHYNEKSRVEENFDSVKAQHKAKITEIEGLISGCAARITSGFEMRPIRCLVLKFRPDNDSSLVVRTDNGRVLRKRRLEPEEKQISLSTEPPLPYVFQVDFYGDTESDVAELVAEGVPVTEAEANELREAIGKHFIPIRKMLDAPEQK